MFALDVLRASSLEQFLFFCSSENANVANDNAASIVRRGTQDAAFGKRRWLEESLLHIGCVK